jgi:uncharacterized membrane protein YkoI
MSKHDWTASDVPAFGRLNGHEAKGDIDIFAKPVESVPLHDGSTLAKKGKIMRKSWVNTLSLSLLIAAAPLVANAASSTDLSSQAKVTMPAARQIALKAYPGKIVKEELEKESGGSGLRYSFDIKSKAGVHEVGVDASNGKVLENSVEGADND